jgi:uncharacterized protein YjgD (DUF1641 family)
MTELQIQDELSAIHSKLDVVLAEISLQQRHRREMDELKEDLMRVGKDVYRTALVELEDVHDQLETGDILYLGKKMLRNVRTLTATFEQLESLRDFLRDAAPLARESFLGLMEKLDELDRKGYFAFVRQFSEVLDRVVTSFSVDDVKKLGDNIVTILTTVKNLTQPEILHTINNALTVYNSVDVQVPENVSLVSLLRELNTPEAKRGLTYAIRFLKAVAASADMNAPTGQGEHHGN